MSKNAIAIFVKTPGLSPIKTRLAETIGPEKALEFYHLSLKAVASIIRQIDAKIYWAVAEQEAKEHRLWSDFDTVWTGGGGLGESQHRIYSQLRESHQNVMLLGVDCPQLTPYMLNSCFNFLQEHPIILGPAEDGGYYLFAGKMDVPLKSWTSVEYSSNNTRAQLIRNLPATAFELQVRADVDDKYNLYAMLRQMPDKPTIEQQALIEWTNEILSDTAGSAA